MNPSRTRSRVVRWFAATVCGALALTGCSVYDIPLPGGADVGDDPITVHVLFRDVLDLVPQSTVKVDDVTVGKVASIRLKDYTADVAIELPADVDLPDNARAEIRQTSLLGEKFISLSEPESPSSGKLGDGDVIGLDSTGRNPEVEEVLGALAAVLTGGGVAQLKTIAEELNTAVGGREEDVRSVLDQLHFFMGQLDRNKDAVVGAIENLDTLASRLRGQDRTIKLALDNIPAALKSVDRQREDLVKMLRAINRLSNVGVRVIDASKEATVDTLRDLSPVLFSLAEAGENFPKSLQVFLTYPFVDAAVGNDPQVARNLHMGDYTNLSIRLDVLDVLKGGLPGLPNLTIGDLLQVCKGANPQLGQVCQQLEPLAGALCSLPGLGSSPVCTTPGTTGGNGGNGGGNGGNGGSDPLGGLGGLGGLLGGATSTSKPKGGGDLGSAVSDALSGLFGGRAATSTPSTPAPGSATGSGSGGSGLSGLLGGLGLGRATPGAAYRQQPAADPYGFADLGLDPSLSTLLLQGVLS